MTTSRGPRALRGPLRSALAANLMEGSPFGILVREGEHLVWVNETLLEQVDCDRAGLLAGGVDGVLADGRLRGLLGTDDRIRISRRNQGGTVHLERVAVDLNEAAATALFFRDITREADLEKSLEQCRQRIKALETHDPETGLLNKHGVMDALERQVARSRRYGNPFSVIRIRLEATRPSAEENEIVRGLSEEFRDRLRWADELGRLDHNSFLLVLPETTAERANLLGTKMREGPIMLARSAEGWVLDVAVAAWQKGEDSRKLLRRVGVDI
ncbi:MAG: GGDEF domain-containing protein [Methylotetracoccus sp.]|nr:GGDEF domain-containing protein [Methylotetracoccus sp.]